MTLEEEITKLEKTIALYEKQNYPRLVITEATQMLEWLKELKRYRENDVISK
jgi:hypothetical protein